MKFVDFGFPEDKTPGAFHANCPAWKVKIKGQSAKLPGLRAWQMKFIHIN